MLDILQKVNKQAKLNKTQKNRKQSEQIQPISGGGKPNRRKQNKNSSQNSKNFLKNVAASGFGILKRIINLLLLIKKYTDTLIQQTKPVLKKRLNSK